VVTGDVLDLDSISSASEGCEAVVHAAAIFSFDPSPFDQSVRDEIAWAVDAGHLPEKYRPRR